MQLQINVWDFKSIGAINMVLNPGINILIGPNGAGKTNVLNALKFLRDVLLRGAGLAVARAGGPIRVYRRHEGMMRFSVVMPYGRRTYKRNPADYWVRWSFAISQQGTDQAATIVEEQLEILASKGGEHPRVFWAAIVRPDGGAPRAFFELANDAEIGRDLFSNLGSVAPGRKSAAFNGLREIVPTALRELRRCGDVSFLRPLCVLDRSLQNLVSAFENLSEYDIHPNIAREATDQIPTAEMLPNGKNLTEVIHALESKNYHRIRTSRISDIDASYPAALRHLGLYNYSSSPYYSYVRMREAPFALENINAELTSAVHLLDRVTVDVDRSSGRRITMFESGKDRFFPEEVSDGTMKWLGILVSLFVPLSSIYLLEEPENFLHPWMQQRLIQLMRERSKVRNRYFVMTTHSTTMLNSAQPDEVALVVPSVSGTLVRRVSALTDVVKILEASDFGLGDLWVSGALGAVPAGEEL